MSARPATGSGGDRAAAIDTIASLNPCVTSTGLSAQHEKRGRAATPFPSRNSDERRNLLSFRVSESNAFLNLLNRVRDQFPGRIGMSAFILRDATEMSLSTLKVFQRTVHFRLASNRNAGTEPDCGSNNGDGEHLVSVLVEEAHARFL